MLVAALIISSCSEIKEADATSIEDGIYLIKEMSETKEELVIGHKNEAIINYSHAFIDNPNEKVEFYLIQSDPFVPLVIKSKPEIKGDSKRLNELQITLVPKYADLLEKYTEKNLGGKVAIVIAGEAVTRHKVRESVKGGRLKITRCTDNACEFLLTALENNVE